MLYSLLAIITGEISSKSEKKKTQKFNEKLKFFFENFNPQESELRKIN
jgi:hypothetical protein